MQEGMGGGVRYDGPDMDEDAELPWLPYGELEPVALESEITGASTSSPVRKASTSAALRDAVFLDTRALPTRGTFIHFRGDFPDPADARTVRTV